MSSSFTYKLRKVRETPGAVLYQEHDGAGKDLDQHSGKVNTQYFRKSAFTGSIPSNLEVTVTFD